MMKEKNITEEMEEEVLRSRESSSEESKENKNVLELIQSNIETIRKLTHTKSNPAGGYHVRRRSKFLP